MTTFGSTEDEYDPIPREVIEARLSKVERATVTGCLQELDIVKQKLENCYEKLGRMTALYQGLQNQFQQFQVQRVKELNLRVNNGPTVIEDGS